MTHDLKWEIYKCNDAFVLELIEKHKAEILTEKEAPKKIDELLFSPFENRRIFLWYKLFGKYNFIAHVYQNKLN